VPSFSSAAWGRATDPRATEPLCGNLALDLPFRSGFLLQRDSSTTHALHYVCRIIFGCSNHPFTTHINVGKGNTIGCLSRSEIGNRLSFLSTNTSDIRAVVVRPSWSQPLTLPRATFSYPRRFFHQ
jgi:hypothetical protein